METALTALKWGRKAVGAVGVANTPYQYGNAGSDMWGTRASVDVVLRVADFFPAITCLSLGYFATVAIYETSITIVNPHFKMIKFIRLLFYHIYWYYYKVDKESRISAKVTTWLVFTLLFGIILYFGFNLISISFDKSIIFHNPYWQYVLLYFIVGFFVGIYVYNETFKKFDSFSDYHVKYYLYFFIIAGFALFVAFYSGSINRERIFKQREEQKISFKLKKENN